MASFEAYPDFVFYWAGQLGANHNSIEKLSGGINNQVFRCGIGDCKWVIKGYKTVQPGQRDRMRAEFQFLQYARRVAPKMTADLVHVDWDRRCVVLENVEGKAYKEGRTPDADSIATATQFIQLLNREPDLAKRYIQENAAEGFLGLRQHIENVRKRINALSCEHLISGTRRKAEYLLSLIHDNFEEIEEKTEKEISSGGILDKIEPQQRCISPSDFGFHNAIQSSDGVRFLDFEFAGWDDPAKATVDFILQPRIPVIGFGSPLMQAWKPELRHSINRRCEVLSPILRLKWLCIMLGVLDPKRLTEILSIHPDENKERIIEYRLESTISYLKRN